MDKTCEADGCDRRWVARRLCAKHYARWKATGQTTLRTTVERFWEKVDKDGPVPAHRPDLGPCWLWTGGTNRHPSGNYGQHWVVELKRKVYAHRYSYELHVGPIPDRLTVDHLCRVRTCVNPAHLEPVTQKVNVQRGVGNGYQHKTHCVRDHPFDEANTRFRKDRPGSRECRACHRLRQNGVALPVPPKSSQQPGQLAS